ncbi:hypothetical protein B0H13DRAFT_2363290 [Mycena leptocephala]|nr:hypothetical protein B0H13DRAFT_2363290 [Mycena leptocephala]
MYLDLRYTVEEPDDAPPAPAGSTNVFLSADTFTYSGGWTNPTDPVPNCVKSGHVHVASVINSTFSFNFTGNILTTWVMCFVADDPNTLGDELFLNTLASSTGGQLALSINGEDPEVFGTSAPTASCALLNLNVTALVRRSLGPRRDSAQSAEAQNQCTGKAVSGTPAIDGATYRKASSGTRVCASTVLFTLGIVVISLALFI